MRISSAWPAGPLRSWSAATAAPSPTNAPATRTPGSRPVTVSDPRSADPHVAPGSTCPATSERSGECSLHGSHDPDADPRPVAEDGARTVNSEATPGLHERLWALVPDA